MVNASFGTLLLSLNSFIITFIYSLLILTFLVFEFISDPGSLNPICPFLPIPNS